MHNGRNSSLWLHQQQPCACFRPLQPSSVSSPTFPPLIPKFRLLLIVISDCLLFPPCPFCQQGCTVIHIAASSRLNYCDWTTWGGHAKALASLPRESPWLKQREVCPRDCFLTYSQAVSKTRNLSAKLSCNRDHISSCNLARKRCSTGKQRSNTLICEFSCKTSYWTRLDKSRIFRKNIESYFSMKMYRGMWNGQFWNTLIYMLYTQIKVNTLLIWHLEIAMHWNRCCLCHLVQSFCASDNY